MSLTKIISSIRILIVCTSCKTSYIVLSDSHWGWVNFSVGSKKRQSPDVRSQEVGISSTEVTHYILITTETTEEHGNFNLFHYQYDQLVNMTSKMKG